MMDKPVEIGAMPNAGASSDGRTIFFDFMGHDGNRYRFKVTHEAMPEIVENLINSAQEAHKLRGGDPLKVGEVLKGRAFEPSSISFALSDAGDAVTAFFESPGRQSIGVTMSQQGCRDLIQELSGVLARLSEATVTAN